MKVKLTCKSCKHEITAFQSDIKEGEYMPKGHNIIIKSIGIKLRMFLPDKVQERINTYELTEPVISKYCTCFCGEKNYLKVLTSEEILTEYDTEHINEDIGEWRNWTL